MADWDVESYKTDHECDEHWELRKNFMLAHKDKMSEDEIVCMAQVFTNIEFMGCRYPEQTMIRVAELAKGVVESFRDKRKNALKRTFVEASNAASAKVKRLTGLGGGVAGAKQSLSIKFVPANQSYEGEEIEEECKSAETPAQVSNAPTSKIEKRKRKKMERKIKALNKGDKKQKRDRRIEALNKSETSTSSTFGDKKQRRDRRIEALNKSETSTSSTFGGGNKKRRDRNIEYLNNGNARKAYGEVKKPSGPFGGFVLFIRNQNPLDTATLSHSASINKSKICYEITPADNDKTCCKVFINGELLAMSTGSTRKRCKKAAAKLAVSILQRICYTVKVKANFFSDSTIGTNTLKQSSKAETTLDGSVLGEDNVGMKLMRMMGWTGGGLGSSQQGIEEPIGVQQRGGPREGLGRCSPGSSIKLFKTKVRSFIKEWLASDSNQDLVFSSEYSNEERKAMHEVASSMLVKSRSYGKAQSRQLVLSKKISPWAVVEELSATNNTEKYELCVPTETYCSVMNKN